MLESIAAALTLIEEIEIGVYYANISCKYVYVKNIVLQVVWNGVILFQFCFKHILHLLLSG